MEKRVEIDEPTAISEISDQIPNRSTMQLGDAIDKNLDGRFPQTAVYTPTTI